MQGVAVCAARTLSRPTVRHQLHVEQRIGVAYSDRSGDNLGERASVANNGREDHAAVNPAAPFLFMLLYQSAA